MIEYFYTGIFTISKLKTESETAEPYSVADLCVDVYNLGQKYLLAGLKQVAAKIFAYYLKDKWSRPQFAWAITKA